ncbi:16S rRNA (cytidine(1402)-2'-O)-methyltransferase [Candidatus Neptunochlamydia vexilliferae]|uniref:Ribosomal RNA small subunit methyltransferase I n=1 Tax=Candidatus Neptunichlamydia vexilliferae TaxID=1651774 RepID=A0ABS0AWJ0_9BACT|nr:16S rRNA (cytidine(1402)-2'-O)-methyltransferase [Candidatus Neptunochlamydia vexilliferae]MBF5058514.1 Ribosomal RNA small subunit methyltransferase I [Candidatus Neptunochlamydia vexilliferae]
MLYVVATPIGNLKDLSHRAIKVLKGVDLILAEDTRTSQVLLKAYGIETPMKSFHLFNERKREAEVMEMLRGGKRMALISDAGTPGICDPGAGLIRRCREEGVKVEVVPGPCAAIAALSLYGSKERFQFIGFLAKKEGELKQQLIDILHYPGLSVAYESPHHLMKTLGLMKKVAPEAKIFVARELTKRYEETVEGTAEELMAHFGDKILGEFVLVFKGKERPFEEDPRKLVEELEKRFGISGKEALVVAAKLLGRPKRELYRDFMG